MTRPVLVTGATGFIGTRLVRRLAGEAVPVRALVRSPGRLPTALRRRVDLVVGSLDRPATLRRALEGVGLVVHLAGLAAAWAPRKRDYFAVNVDGVRRLLAAAELEGVQRVVHVSTVLTRFPDDGPPTPYVASKRMGERAALDFAASGADVVVVQPCRVYGPGPLNDANGVTRLIRSVLHHRFPVRLRDDGVRASYVHVDDVVDGLLLAGRHGRAGDTYVIGGECCSVAALIRQVAELAGVTPRTVAVPPGLAFCFAAALELGGRLGAPVPITRAWVRSFLRDQSVDIRPTTEALGYRPRPLREGLTETIAWLRSRNGGAG